MQFYLWCHLVLETSMNELKLRATFSAGWEGKLGTSKILRIKANEEGKTIHLSDGVMAFFFSSFAKTSYN